ncbi:MAG: amidohydrolase family protein, partial [Gordonia sp. (in: high G+C Gram-positive bacteria)]
MRRGLVVVDADLGTGMSQQIRIEPTRPGQSVITAIGPRVNRIGADILDAAGNAVLPGFTDHHLHLHALAVTATSVQCGPPAVHDAHGLRMALRSARPDSTGWIRGIGYVETVAGELTRARLDAIDSTRPLRIAHRSGAMWMFNSAAIAATGLQDAAHPGIERDEVGRATGRIWRADDWLRSRLPGPTPPSLHDVGARLRQLGIIEMTDATPELDHTAISNIVSAVDNSDIHGRVHLLGVGLGDRVDHPRITVGPYKIVIADAPLPTLDEVVERIRTAHAAGRAVAVHCVSRIAFALLTAAFDVAGVRRGDRIEHGAVLPAAAAATLADRQIAVITQPGFISDRGDDFLDGAEPRDHPDLYRCGSLLDAGVTVAFSSDAPYGPLDPWRIVAAATVRRTHTGRVVGGPAEILDTA